MVVLSGEKVGRLSEMGSTQNTVYYCSISVGAKVLVDYSSRDSEVDAWAALCLEKAPQFHAWYFQQFRNRIFAFLMEDGHVYFTITNERLGKKGVFEFLGVVKENFNAIVRRGAAGSSDLTSFTLHSALLPALHNLVQSLESVYRVNHDHRINEVKFPNDSGVCRDEEEEIFVDESEQVYPLAGSNQIAGASCPLPLSKSSRSSIRAARQNWWQCVWILLAVDAVFCLILFGIWYGICDKLSCLSS